MRGWRRCFLDFDWLGGGRRRFKMRFVQRSHDVLPGLLGKRIEELVAFAGVHGVDNGGEVLGGEEIEQGVGVEIGELAHKTSREMRGQTAKQETLLIEGQSHYGVGGVLGLEAAEHFGYGGPANLGDQIAELLNEFSHKGRTSLLQVQAAFENEDDSGSQYGAWPLARLKGAMNAVR